MQSRLITRNISPVWVARANFHRGVARIFSTISECGIDGDATREVELAFLDSSQEKLTVLSWSEDWRIHSSLVVPLISASHQIVLMNCPTAPTSSSQPTAGSQGYWTLLISKFSVDSPFPFWIPQELLPVPLVHPGHANRHLQLVIATCRVARLTLQTRKLWCRDQPPSALLLSCPNVQNLEKQKKNGKNASKKKQEKREKRNGNQKSGEK